MRKVSRTDRIKKFIRGDKDLGPCTNWQLSIKFMLFMFALFTIDNEDILKILLTENTQTLINLSKLVEDTQFVIYLKSFDSKLD